MTDTATLEVRELSKADRCDKCGAEARVIALFPAEVGTLELLFCLHHGTEHKDKLIASALIVKAYT